MERHWIYKTRCFELPCHHRLISATLQHAENLDTFGKCMGLFGHGHNYKLKVSFRYLYDPEDPFFDQTLALVIMDEIVKPFAYTSLNESFQKLGVPNPITTGEQIISVFAHILQSSHIKPHLHSMELVETRRNSFFWNFCESSPGKRH